MPTNISSLFVRADEGDSLFLASGEFLTWKATGEVTGGRYDQLEFTTLPHSGPPEHTHTQDELFYFLAGTYRVKLGEHVFTASAGDFLRIPAGTSHTWRCIGKNVGKILLTYVPGGLRGFFEEMQPLYLAPELDLPAAMAIAAKYGMEVTGPPLTE
ncbi:MAG TPA: cupin domain-containing protein [Ktedonobacteraceae bacterium]